MLAIFLGIECRMDSSCSASYAAMLLRIRWSFIFLGLLRQNIKCALLGPSVLMIFERKNVDNKTFTGKFAGAKAIRSSFFLLYNDTFRRKSWKEDSTIK